jgi:3-oxoacyl-[acyl-carrier protein] reductase
VTVKLQDRVAVITGAEGSIGQATARTLQREGAKLYLVDIAPRSNLPLFEGAACYASVDVTDPNSAKAVVDGALAAFGALDILVNIAGVTSFGAASVVTRSEWDRVIDVNLKSVFFCCQAAIPALKRSSAGRVVNISSVLGKNGGNARPWIDSGEQARAGNVVYGISKAGINAMTAYLARELASDGITVNAVAPGPIASAMTTTLPETLKALIPLSRMGKPEDVAEAVLYLSSDAASFVTGEVLDVNGGLWCD